MDAFIVEEAARLKKEYGTKDPFALLELLGVQVKYNDAFRHLKAFYYIMLGIPYVVLNSQLDPVELKIVAAHELGHHILHKEFAQISPIRELGFYDPKSGLEYEANLFAAELLTEDSEITDLLAEGLDYFQICSIVGAPPEFLAFKINSMQKRGYPITLPVIYKSDFLAK